MIILYNIPQATSAEGNPLISEYSTEKDFTSLIVVGNKVYAMDFDKLNIIDISNPENPSLAGIFDDVYNFEICEVIGENAYVYSNIMGEICILNIIDPENPSLVGIYDDDDLECIDMVIVGNYAYLANEENLMIINKQILNKYQFHLITIFFI